MRIRYRLMDTDNGGIEWSDWYVGAEIRDARPDTEGDPDVAARQIARINWEAVTGTALGPDEDPPGKLTAAAGSHEHGIAWIDDRDEQGATTIVIEWHTLEEG